jgi:serine/threonine protein kinase
MSTSSGSWITGEVRLLPADQRQLREQMATDLGTRYTVREFVGQGAFATVWHADDPEGPIAIKRFHSVSMKPRAFYHELNVLLRLKHPHIVRAVNLLEADSGARYLMMEYCPGGTLRPVLSRARRAGATLDVREVLRLGRQLGSALQAAHTLGIVHRDLKPENILFTATPQLGRPLPPVKLADFGLARLTSSSRPGGALTGLSGSPAYMAPEMFMSNYVPASDWYSLGVVLFEAATGHLPFLGTVEELARSHLRERPPLDALPPQLNDLISPLLRKEPAERPSPAEWLDQLRTLLPEPPVNQLTREDRLVLERDLSRLDPVLAALTALRRGRKSRLTDADLLNQYGFTTSTTHPAMSHVMDWSKDDSAQGETMRTELESDPEPVSPVASVATVAAAAEEGATVESILGQFDWR